MSPHTVLVTGGSSGLGLQIVRRLYTDSTAYEIIIACRDAAKGNRVAESLRAENGDCSNSLSVIEMDVERDDSIGKAFQSVRQQHEHIDTIINNAGGNFDPQLAEGKIGVRDLWQKTWNINVAGAQIKTQTFMSLLLKASSPRLIFITSGTSSIAGTERMDTTSMRMMNSSPEAGWPKPLSGNPTTAYRSAKTGLNMMVREWHRMLKNDGVKVFAVAPGFLATSLGGHSASKLKEMGAQDPSVGAGFVVDVVKGERDSDAGKAIDKDGIQPW